MQLFHPQPSENPIRVTQEATLAIHVDEMVADERILIQARDDHVSVELPHDAQGFRRRAVFDDGNEAFRIDQAAEMALEDEVPDRVLDAAGGDKGLDRRGPLRGGILRGIGPCALVHPRSFRDGVGARLDGWIPRTPSRGLAAGVVELGSGGGTSGRVGRRLPQGGRVGCKSLYSECCRSSVPDNLTTLVAYHVVVPFHHARRPCGRSYDR
ncbi:hypothetical protein BHM03_00039856 [Ensete ventricosum]|nr:hypothetical protein BHM03_00039856 [Ensete ventricosum]